jgi:hypothetical protein
MKSKDFPRGLRETRGKGFKASRFALLSMASLGAAFALVLPGAADATTSPDIVHRIAVTLTNSKISIPRDQFVKADGVTRYPRGAVIVFVLKNKGTKPMTIRLTVGSASTKFVGSHKLLGVASAGKPIQPGASRRFELSFFFRGTFLMQSTIAGKIAVSRPIIIF